KDHYTLKLTTESQEILFKGKRVSLVSPDVIKERQETGKQDIPKKLTKKEQARNDLFETLRKLRKDLADKAGKPPFAVFNDTTLYEMVVTLPTTYEEFLNVDGVGDYKAKAFATPFLQTIASFMATSKVSDTYKTTWALYNQGLDIKEIARERNIQITTVYSHLAKLLSDGYPISVHELIDEETLMMVNDAINHLGYLKSIKPYFEFLEGKVEYGKIRVALSYLETNRNGS
ncbi:MAG: helix-turn-helix domain-containing protein, partial [Candidatus Brocadiia bacterium]